MPKMIIGYQNALKTYQNQPKKLTTIHFIKIF